MHPAAGLPSLRFENSQRDALGDGVSVVIPIYNGEETLVALVQRLEPVLRQTGRNFELVMVNDGSQDRSWDTICELAQQHAWLEGVDMMRNYGQHNAFLAGIRTAHYDTLVTMDDDLQNPPEEIPILLRKMNEGFDVVYGVPAKQQHGLRRDLASMITKVVLQRAMGAEVARSISAFRAFRTRLRKAFSDYNAPYVSIDVLLTWGTTHFSAVEVAHHPRRTGRSGYTVWKLIAHALNMMTGFSTLPLQLASLTGFVFTLFGLGILLFVIGRYLAQGSPIPGFPFLASIISIFSGVQLFSLGILGEYIARMHVRNMGQPSSVVRAYTPRHIHTNGETDASGA